MPFAFPADPATLRKYSTWFIVYGVVTIALGLFALLAPGVATLAVGLMVGWLLMFAGAFGLLAVFSSGRDAPGFWWHMLTSILYLLAGFALLARPVAGVITLTILFTAYLLAGGIIRIMLAFGYRTAIPGAWGWLLVSGVVDIVLALIIISGMPGTAIWVLGVLAGINLMMMGISILMAAFAVRKAIAA